MTIIAGQKNIQTIIIRFHDLQSDKKLLLKLKKGALNLIEEYTNDMKESKVYDYDVTCCIEACRFVVRGDLIGSMNYTSKLGSLCLRNAILEDIKCLDEKELEFIKYYKSNEEDEDEIVKGYYPIEFGDGKLGEVIGIGTYGSVHTQKGIENRCIKVQSNTELSEIVVLKHLCHPNIISIIQIHIENNTNYILMEKGDRPLSRSDNYRQNIKYIREILLGISYLSANNIIHRDLKFGNIVMFGDSIKIIDFNTSIYDGKHIYNLREPDNLFGTQGYKAPEVKWGSSYDNRVDVWAVGIITLRLLCERYSRDCVLALIQSYDYDDEEQEEKYNNMTYKLVDKFMNGHYIETNTPEYDLLSKMLHKDMEGRISAEEATKHILFCEYEDEDIETIEQPICTNIPIEYEFENPNIDRVKYRMALNKLLHSLCDCDDFIIDMGMCIFDSYYEFRSYSYDGKPIIGAGLICVRLANNYYDEDNHMCFNDMSILANNNNKYLRELEHKIHSHMVLNMSFFDILPNDKIHNEV